MVPISYLNIYSWDMLGYNPTTMVVYPLTTGISISISLSIYIHILYVCVCVVCVCVWPPKNTLQPLNFGCQLGLLTMPEVMPSSESAVSWWSWSSAPVSVSGSTQKSGETSSIRGLDISTFNLFDHVWSILWGDIYGNIMEYHETSRTATRCSKHPLTF